MRFLRLNPTLRWLVITLIPAILETDVIPRNEQRGIDMQILLSNSVSLKFAPQIGRSIFRPSHGQCMHS